MYFCLYDIPNKWMKSGFMPFHRCGIVQGHCHFFLFIFHFTYFICRPISVAPAPLSFTAKPLWHLPPVIWCCLWEKCIYTPGKHVVLKATYVAVKSQCTSWNECCHHRRANVLCQGHWSIPIPSYRLAVGQINQCGPFYLWTLCDGLLQMSLIPDKSNLSLNSVQKLLLEFLFHDVLACFCGLFATLCIPALEKDCFYNNLSQLCQLYINCVSLGYRGSLAKSSCH